MSSSRVLEAAKLAAESRATGPGLRVLVAEDDDADRIVLVEAVKRLGYDCRAARDGREAWEMHQRSPADIILSDWKMPRMDGLELCRQTRVSEARAHYTYFVFMTSFRDKEHFVRGMEAGADDYQTKPVDLDELRVRLRSASRVVGLYRTLAAQNAALRRDSQESLRLAHRDALTGISNRLAMDQDLSALWPRAKRYPRHYSIAICDIDRFKCFNDQFGHLVGDEVLRRVSAAIQHELRESDGLYRYGGEEFVVLLPEQSVQDARLAMDRVRLAVERLAIPASSERPVVTISCGVAELDVELDGSPDDWLRRADCALYRAKSNGRNRVEADPESAPSNHDVVADLARPEAYGRIRPSRIDRIETHISWVFLLDHDVYKVKKPVSFGFLDFRSLDRRKAACEAEVELNGRLAPDVYKGVVPLHCGADGTLTLDGTGPIVEWAVHMRRLDDEQRADVLLRHGRLSPERIEQVAVHLAHFHAHARCDAATAAFGTQQAIERNIEENFAQTRETLGSYLTPDQVDEIVRWQRLFAHGQAPLFEERVSAGRVRDGHGDLRLEHVYFDGASPTVIDCIEFNERFRFGDVCVDIAFLSMDLAAQGRVDLAEHFLARYAREANDYDLYALVDFYESYRAFVRGKIAAWVAADEHADSASRLRARLDARRYMMLALSAHRRSTLSPCLVVVGGVIASGKTTIADRIGRKMSAPIVDADRTRKAMAGVDPAHPFHEPAWQGVYDPAVSDAVYQELLRRAGVVLSSGRPVVVEASFRSMALRRLARDLALLHKVPFHFVECRADPAVCRTRLVERAKGASISDGRLEIFEAFLAQYEPIRELSAGEHLIVDTTQPLERTLDAIDEHLATWPPGLTD